MAKKKKSVKPVAAKKAAATKKVAAKKTPAKATKKSTPPVASKQPSAKSYASAIGDKRTTSERIAALSAAPLAVCKSDSNLQATLAIIENREEPIDVRLEALQSLQAASFRVVAFEPCRADYIATLHKVSDDPDPELRQRVLGILARENDKFVQKKLLDGLKAPTKALVPPEKALQLLSYNPHAGAFKVAREVVDTPPNSTAKQEALRLLSADMKSVDLFEKVLSDKTETTEARQISASALHALHPDILQTKARDIVLDSGENSELQAACLTALTNFGDQEKVANDSALMEHVSRLTAASTASVKQSAQQFLMKYTP